jgi:asparagine synthase (glutamine-hydrolysing)
MSGIAGIFHRDGQPLEAQALERMLAALAHRGPDGSGFWQTANLGLGQSRFVTASEAQVEQLPLLWAGGDLILCADARIDNRDELLDELDLKEHPAEASGDGGLILAAYEKWDQDCPARLVGDFAFAIWDQARKRLFCARDHIGVKPFYYHLTPKAFLFASEIKALLAIPTVPRRLNERRIAEYLRQDFEDKTDTSYQDIYRLPPAHSLIVTPERVQIHAYWSLDPDRSIRFGCDEEYIEAFREIFRQAVSCRLRSPLPPACALSGGLDSTAIACTARLLLGEAKPVHTFSAIYPGFPPDDRQKIDEQAHIRAVVETGGFTAHFVQADRYSSLADLPRLLWHLDEAYFAPTLNLHWALYDSVRQHGLRVFLDGSDGDETVSHGLERLTDLARAGRWLRLVREARMLSGRALRPSQAGRIIWKHGIRPLVPAGLLSFFRLLYGMGSKKKTSISILNPAFARRMGFEAQELEPGQASAPIHDTARQRHAQRLNSGLIPYALELLDKVAAAFTIEARYPFFDRRLLEYCLALPAEKKLGQGWTRLILRQSLAGLAPGEIQWRSTKADFSPSLVRGLLTFERQRMEHVICGEAESLAPYIDLPAVQSAYQSFLANSGQSFAEAQVIYSVLMLHSWLETADLKP